MFQLYELLERMPLLEELYLRNALPESSSDQTTRTKGPRDTALPSEEHIPGRTRPRDTAGPENAHISFDSQPEIRLPAISQSVTLSHGPHTHPRQAGQLSLARFSSDQ